MVLKGHLDLEVSAPRKGNTLTFQGIYALNCSPETWCHHGLPARLEVYGDQETNNYLGKFQLRGSTGFINPPSGYFSNLQVPNYYWNINYWRNSHIASLTCGEDLVG
jgi:hypothetical protein